MFDPNMGPKHVLQPSSALSQWPINLSLVEGHNILLRLTTPNIFLDPGINRRLGFLGNSIISTRIARHYGCTECDMKFAMVKVQMSPV